MNIRKLFVILFIALIAMSATACKRPWDPTLAKFCAEQKKAEGDIVNYGDEETACPAPVITAPKLEVGGGNTSSASSAATTPSDKKPSDVVVPPPASSSSASSSSVTSGTCPTTAQAKIDTGMDVQRLKTEPCAFVWRSFPKSAPGKVAAGYIGTVHFAANAGDTEGMIQVFKSPKTFERIYAGTFRYKAGGYPANDAVNNPCELLKKEQDFGADEDPSFPVTAGDFTCR